MRSVMAQLAFMAAWLGLFVAIGYFTGKWAFNAPAIGAALGGLGGVVAFGGLVSSN